MKFTGLQARNLEPSPPLTRTFTFVAKVLHVPNEAPIRRTTNAIGDPNSWNPLGRNNTCAVAARWWPSDHPAEGWEGTEHLNMERGTRFELATACLETSLLAI